MAGLSSFPSNIDSFTRHYEISAADVPSVVRFQELKLKIRTPEEESEMAQLATKLRPNFISSEDFNKFQDALVSMQIFIRDNVAGYIDTARDEALIAIDQKKNAIIVYLDSIEAGKLRNDMGIMDELTTATKSSLVAAINEVNAKAPSNASTSTKGIVQLSSTQSTSESLAATPKLVKDHADLNTASVHGSTSAATANRLIHRDVNGRAKVAVPSASDDIARLDTITGQVGTLSSLQTTAKTNVVSAINEVFQSGVSAKQGIVDAINAMGGSASTSDTWAILSAKIRAIKTGKKYVMGTFLTDNLGRGSVSGLEFLPRNIIISNGAYNGGSSTLGGVYSVDAPHYNPPNGVTNPLSHIFSNSTGYIGRDQITVFANGFNFTPTSSGDLQKTYNYIAFE